VARVCAARGSVNRARLAVKIRRVVVRMSCHSEKLGWWATGAMRESGSCLLAAGVFVRGSLPHQVRGDYRDTDSTRSNGRGRNLSVSRKICKTDRLRSLITY
jgi:hypothetical protein